MAVGCLPPPLALFAPSASSLPDALSPVAFSFFAILLVRYFSVASTCLAHCECCSWVIHSNSSPPNCFVCAANRLHVRSAAHRLLSGLFSRPHRDELPTPPSTSVSGLHTISSLLTAVIRIVFFFFFSLCCWFPFLYFCCYLFFFPLFSCTFSFLFLVVIRLYHHSLICPVLLWSIPWVVDVNNFLAFGLKMMSFSIRILLSRMRNKRYLCIGWCLFGAELILNFTYSHGLADAFGYG